MRVWGRYLYLLLGLGIVICSSIADAKTCAYYFKLENPLPLKTFLIQRNLDSEQFSFKAQGNSFIVYYNQKPMVEFLAKRRFNWDVIYPQTVDLSVTPKPKGLGTIAYLFYARIVYLKTGLLLQSDSDSHLSPSAKAVWDRFVFLGYASRGSFYTFIPSIMENKDLWTEIDTLLQKVKLPSDFLQNPSRVYFD